MSEVETGARPSVEAWPSDASGVTGILLSRACYANVVSHAVRKLSGHYLDGETAERKAFGMLTGRHIGSDITVTGVFPLVTNMRHDARHQTTMDEVVGEYAIPSETPLEQRGWIANPRELLDIERVCDGTDWLVFGNYHTHRVAWPHDPHRDTCTELDRMLAAGSGQWTLILSVVDITRPRLRAFFEGDNAREAPIRITP
jgi:hypothetical protein